MEPNPFISLDDVTLRVGDTWLLPHTSWQINRGENWVIWGANGAGKTTLARAMTGEVAVVQGCIRRYYPDATGLEHGRSPIALVSSDQYHQLVQRERLVAEMRHFSGRYHEFTTAGDVLNAAGKPRVDVGPWPLIEEKLNLKPLLAKPVEALSSGEMRKLLLGRALLSDPDLLILDEPFNGLDAGSREMLGGILAHLAAGGTQMLLITHRRTEIPAFFSHLVHLAHGRVVWQGRIEDFHTGLPGQSRPEEAAQAPAEGPGCLHDPQPDKKPEEVVLVRMRRVSVRYGGKQALDGIDWTVRRGENWALTGPNGAGKTTLLKLITGDNLQGYANELILFGQRKGSGETVWDIKKHIGYIGDDLQARYQRRMTGFDVICSGFFDSVGLYRRCTPEQQDMARQWVVRLALKDLVDRCFEQLSFGQQRLILIARAMVKSPRLLILDEPCNGLDESSRRRLLRVLEIIGRDCAANMIFVSHRADEMPSCITHRMCLSSGRAVICGPIDTPQRTQRG